MSEDVNRPAQRVSAPAKVRSLALGYALQELGQIWIVWMTAGILGRRIPLQTLVLVPVILAAHERVNQLEPPQLTCPVFFQ